MHKKTKIQIHKFKWLDIHFKLMNKSPVSGPSCMYYKFQIYNYTKYKIMLQIYKNITHKNTKKNNTQIQVA